MPPVPASGPSILESNITGGLVNSTYSVENFPSYPEIHGMELMERMRKHIDSLGVDVIEVCEVETAELAGVKSGSLRTAETILLLPSFWPPGANPFHWTCQRRRNRCTIAQSVTGLPMWESTFWS